MGCSTPLSPPDGAHTTLATGGKVAELNQQLMRVAVDPAPFILQLMRVAVGNTHMSCSMEYVRRGQPA